LVVEIVEERGETTFCNHVTLEKCSERVVAEGLWEACPKRLTGPRVVTQPKVATDDVFEESDRLRLDELVDHVAEDGADGKEALVSVANIGQPRFVEQDLLDDEDGDRLGEFRAGLHDAEAEWNDLCGKEEVYDRVVVVLLDEGSYDAKGGETQVFKGTRFGSRIQERIKKD